MKLCRINLSDKVGVLPQLYYQRNGTGLLLAGIVGAGISTVGAVGSSLIQSNAAASMNKETREWQEKEWSRQFELTNQRQDELNAEERAYNTPAANSQRLQEAGFNPAALAAGSSMQLSQASPDVTAHSPAMPQTVNATPNDMGVAKSFEALGSLVKNLASAQKDGADTSKIMALLDTEVKKAVQDLHLSEVVVAMHKQEYFYNDKAIPVKLKKLNEEYLNLAAKTYNEALTGKELVSRTAMLDAQKKLLDANSELSAVEKMRAAIIVANSQRLFDATIDELKTRSSSQVASAAASYASAEESYAHAGLFREETGLRSVERAIAEGTKDEQIFAKLNELAAKKFKSQKEAKETYLELERLRKIADAYDNSVWLKKIDAALDHVKERFPSFINIVKPK